MAIAMTRRFLAASVAALSIAAATPAIAAESTVPYAMDPFTDVKATSAGYEGIEYLRKNKVIRGYQDGTFKPDRLITRAEFAQMLTNPFLFRADWKSSCLKEKNIDGSDTVFFSDVSIDGWYAEAVCTAKVYELINGYPDGTYRPLRPINFVEAAKIATRVFSLNVVEDKGEFWYKPYINRLGELNAIPTSIKRLDQQITRGEMAEIVYRLKAQKTDKPSMTVNDLK